MATEKMKNMLKKQKKKKTREPVFETNKQKSQSLITKKHQI